jgi:hypothetical protein
MGSTNIDNPPPDRAIRPSAEEVAGAIPDLSEVSLRALGQFDDDEFEQAAADALRHLQKQDSSVAGHNS